MSDYRVVYFATHALVAGDIERFTRAKAEPALVLSIPARPSEEDNGLLTASEVATLKLNGDFVVLSACDTAAGDKPGAVEAIAGGAGPLDLAAKLANSIGRSNTLHKTYAPVDIEAVRNTDAARLRGRQRMRAENKSGEKVSKQQPIKVSNFKPGNVK